jgi:hypothetical protein
MLLSICDRCQLNLCTKQYSSKFQETRPLKRLNARMTCPTRIFIYPCLWHTLDDGWQTLRSLYSAGSMRPQVDSTQLASSPELTDRLVASRGVVFRLRISPRIRSRNRNGSKGNVTDSWGTDFCKTPENPPHCHVPLNTPFKYGHGCLLRFKEKNLEREGRKKTNVAKCRRFLW